MTARSISLTADSTAGSTVASQQWEVAFPTDVQFTSYVANIFQSDTYTLTIDGVTVETKVVTGPSTATTFTPAAPMSLSAGVHTFKLIGTAARRYYYKSGNVNPLSGDPAYGEWGWWQEIGTHTPAGTINFTDTANQFAAGEERNNTSGSAWAAQTWSVTFDTDVSFMAYVEVMSAADTYTLKIDGTTVATAVVSAAQRVASFIPAAPVALTAGAHTFKIQPTANRTFNQRTTDALVGSGHVTAWGAWQEVASTNRAPGKLGFTVAPPTSGTASLTLSASGGAAASSAASASLSVSASGSAAALAAGSASLSLSAAGNTVAPEPAAGTANLDLSASGGAGAGGAGSAALSLSAAGSATLAAAGSALLTLSAVGSAFVLYLTDLANAMNGRRRRARGVTSVDRAPAAPPVGRTFGTRYDKAIAYPVPDMVDGRPT